MGENFKIYLLDIFSILLPGALLMIVLKQYEYTVSLFGKIFPDNKDAWINVVIFLGVAYMLGHFIFFVGSFLDNWIFQNVKRVFWNDHKLTAYVLVLKNEKLGIEDPDVINAFKWSLAYLLANKPEMYTVVERHIAESKFFRSVVVVLFLAMVALFIESYYWLGLVCFGLIILSLLRYITQRQKSIETAYQYVITAAGNYYSAVPELSLLNQLRTKNIYPCGKDVPGQKNKLNSRRCVVIKVWAVIKLCLIGLVKSPK